MMNKDCEEGILEASIFGGMLDLAKNDIFARLESLLLNFKLRILGHNSLYTLHNVRRHNLVYRDLYNIKTSG